MKTKTLTKEEWLQLGAESKLLDKLMLTYTTHMSKTIGKNHALTKRAEKLFQDMKQLKSDLEDMTPTIPDATKIFYGDFTNVQKSIINKIMENTTSH